MAAKGFPPSRIAATWGCSTGISAENETLVTTIDRITNEAVARDLIGFSAGLAVLFRPEDGVTYCIECWPARRSVLPSSPVTPDLRGQSFQATMNAHLDRGDRHARASRGVGYGGTLDLHVLNR